MLRNGDFTDGNSTEKPWETLPPIPEAGNLRNQRPFGWELSWLDPGTPLYDDPNSTARGIPECVHKLSEQLPPNEQLGGPNALILAGDKTYKIFSATASFGATLSQKVEGLEPGSSAVLTVPIQAHRHGGTDPWGVESGVWVNGVGSWVNGGAMGDRRWYEHEVEFDVPDSGKAEILIRVKSKHNHPADFFFDNITLDAEVDENGGNGGDPPPSSTKETLYVQVPGGMQIKKGVSDETDVIEINVPANVIIEVV